MTLKIMSWNVRGVNNQDKRKVLKAFIRSKKVDIVCLQEIKVQNMSVGLVRSLGLGRFLDWGWMRRVLLGESLSFGIRELWSWLIWKLGSSQSLAVLETVQMAPSGCSLGFMALLWIVKGSFFRSNWELLEAYGMGLGAWEGTSIRFASLGNAEGVGECLTL